MVGRALNNCVGMCCACETGAHTIYWMFGMRCPCVPPATPTVVRRPVGGRMWGILLWVPARCVLLRW